MTRKVYIAGHGGLVGGALTRWFEARDDVELVHGLTEHVDLRDQSAARAAIHVAAPTELVLVAGRVGGLGANLADPVGFLEDNLAIQLSVLRAAYEAGVERLLFIASANAYPADATQPINESSLGTGAIDPDTEPYGLAKLVGIRQCEAYRRQHGLRWHSVLPCNLYGIGDRFDRETAHLVAATLRRFSDALLQGADKVEVWGSGEQRRQLMFADDLAAACDSLLQLDDPPSAVNAGPAGDVSVRELSELAAATVGYHGAIDYDTTRPEGVLRRELDTTLLHSLGWSPTIDLVNGLQQTWNWYRQTAPEIAAPAEGATA